MKRTRITEEIVREIRKMDLVKGSHTHGQSVVARRFRISQGQVSSIRSGKIWAHVK